MEARRVVRADAVFEAGLGLALVLGALTEALDDADFPTPVGRLVLLAVGILLILLGVILWTDRVGVRALALGNALTCIAGLVWLVAARGFSVAGLVVVAAAVAGLAGLAAAQALSLRA
jgi:hypothetical protein